jgi:hypothetical protein
MYQHKSTRSIFAMSLNRRRRWIVELNFSFLVIYLTAQFAGPGAWTIAAVTLSLFAGVEGVCLWRERRLSPEQSQSSSQIPIS